MTKPYYTMNDLKNSFDYEFFKILNSIFRGKATYKRQDGTIIRIENESEETEPIRKSRRVRNILECARRRAKNR